MRLDKFLKIARIIKRRTIANEACSQGRVTIGGKVAKPSAEVKIGDIIELRIGGRVTKFEVTALSEHVSKDQASELYKVI